MSEQERESVRPDLAETLRRRKLVQDESRGDVVAARHASGRSTARENLAELCDEGSFVEYGGFAIAAQRARRTVDDLVQRTPADGLIAGTARVNSALVGNDRAHCAVLSYDYTVLAGTQGVMGHRKKDRLFEVIERRRLPVVLFAEGGGGRPGDTDHAMVAGLDVMAFALWARLSGLVPRIGVASGRCFAGNAALLGCSDLIIATPEASIGMGGPAMIEGGGLGVVDADKVGPFDVQVQNGVIDIAAADDADAVRLARQALSFFQGSVASWEASDQRALRDVVPENRRRAYDVHRAIEILVDAGSSLELRPRFGRGMVTTLARIEGHPVGIVANNPMHLAGAITSDGADKAARFLQLCEAFRLPVLFLCENNRYAMGTSIERALANVDITAKAAAYSIPAEAVDGMNVFAVEDATRRAADAVREDGPRLIEFRTYRYRAHSMYDPELYRSKEEVERWRDRDPLLTFPAQLRASGYLDDESTAAMEQEIAREIDAAIAYADAGTLEPVSDLTRFVYSERVRA